MKEEKTIIYRESLWQSILADIISVAFLLGAFWVNTHYIQSKLLSAIILLLFLLKLVAYAGARKNVFTDKQKAIDYINS